MTAFDDEREALADLIAEERDKWPRRADDMDSGDLAEAILAAGFHRQGPITDAFVDRVYDSLSADVRYWLGLDDLRDAMEAARDAS